MREPDERTGGGDPLVALAAEWVLYDDRSAAPCTSLPTEEQVVQCNAYMLFYEKLSTLE